MKKILNIVGARPQFIKAAAISRAIRNDFSDQLIEVIVHSGQHYDENMSDIFFEELQIPAPKFHFDIRSIPHIDQVFQMTKNFETVIAEENPDLIILYGDTKTTLAGTYAAGNMNIPIAHIEAGLRSHDSSMPEEYNRFICDHASSLLFCPTDVAICNLKEEGFNHNLNKPISSHNPAVFFSGDVMYDSLLFAKKMLRNKSLNDIKPGLEQNEYLMCTIHRNFNSDDSKRLSQIFESLMHLANKEKIKIIIPLHPRTRKQLDDFLPLINKIENCKYLNLIEPLSYFDFLNLLRFSKLLITDSGGLQKESYWIGKGSIVIRENTEWVELINGGYSVISSPVFEDLLAAYNKMKTINIPSKKEYYGNGFAAQFICQTIIDSFPKLTS